MATIVSITPTGFSITGLTQPWTGCNLAPLARDIGALCVAWGDILQQSLVVVCDTAPLARDMILMRLLSILKDKKLYSRQQEVSFISFDSALTLVRFEAGLPDGDHIAYKAAHPSIGNVVYGNSHMVLVRAKNAKHDDWQAGLRAVWKRLRMNGIPSNNFSNLPSIDLPWKPAKDPGQIIMVDPGLAIIQTHQQIHGTFKPEDHQHEAMPIVIGGNRNFVLAAGDSWPDDERTILSSAGVRFHIEVGRTATALAAIGYLSLDAPLIVL